MGDFGQRFLLQDGAVSGRMCQFLTQVATGIAFAITRVGPFSSPNFAYGDAVIMGYSISQSLN
jgi:hypothetical protein